MRISATGDRVAGFTLVELMVVLAIMAFAGAAVMVAMPDPRGDLRAEGERFAARARAAEDEAIVEARDMALWIGPSGYGFERRERGVWKACGERPFQRESWSEGTQALVGAAGRGRVRFDTTGLVQPLDLILVRDDARVAIRIEADGTIHVE